MSHIARRLMNRGRGREREVGRLLARGRYRASSDLVALLSMADDLLKDGTGATTGESVHTPVPGGPDEVPRHNSREVIRKSRLSPKLFRD